MASDSINELAGPVEIIYEVLKYKGIDINYFEKVQKKKAEERGAFDKRLLLIEVVED